MDHRPGEPLLIVGSSARAAAFSARLRGRKPIAIDIFGDADLRALASPCVQVSPAEWPGRIVELARSLPEAPFIIAGGLENHPRIVRALEFSRRNEGTPAARLAAARDPFRVAAAFSRAGLPCPRVRRDPPPAAEARRWLEKPRRGCGGRGIAFAGGSDRPRSGVYFQEWIDGLPCAAVFEGAADGSVRLLGVTRQLVGEAALGALPFAYCGSLGPWALPWSADAAFERIGGLLADQFGLRGLFGVDAVLVGEVPYAVEVNPRYPASAEILDRAAFGLAPGPTLWKAVLFARSDLVFDAELRDALEAELAAGEELADLPMPGSAIAAGQPVLSAIGPADSLGAGHDRVRRLGGRFQAHLASATARSRPLPNGAPRA
jgi:predicted ATP-grasp superfamily ATP-dependent carboligase